MVINLDFLLYVWRTFTVITLRNFICQIIDSCCSIFLSAFHYMYVYLPYWIKRHQQTPGVYDLSFTATDCFSTDALLMVFCQDLMSKLFLNRQSSNICDSELVSIAHQGAWLLENLNYHCTFQCFKLLYTMWTKFRGYIGIPLSVCLSVCADSCPAHNFFGFDISLPYLAHGSITLRGGVAYIHDPDMTLNLDLKVKFIEVLTFLHVRPITSVWYNICIPY